VSIVRATGKPVEEFFVRLLVQNGLVVAMAVLAMLILLDADYDLYKSRWSINLVI
jgi:hypothetical protein